MDRREFLKVLYGLGKGIVLTSIVSSLPFNCRTKNGVPPKKIEKINCAVEDNVLTQTGSRRGNVKIGVIADPHANQKNVEYFVNQLEQEKVDLYLVAGDLSWSFGDYEGSRNDYDEITRALKPILSTGKLVLAYAGNHEQKETWQRAIADISSKYNTFVDMETVRVADLTDLTIVALGGNDNPRFNVPNGFLLSERDFEEFRDIALKYQKDKPLLLATHIPQRYLTERGLDKVDERFGGNNVGSEYLRWIREAIDSKFAISGHIHEAFGIIAPHEEPIKQGELSDRLDFNPGATWDHLQRPHLKPAAGILEFMGNQARAYILNR